MAKVMSHVDVAIRQAQPEDVPTLAEICLIADREIAHFLYEGLLPGSSAFELMRQLCAARGTTCSFEYFLLAVDGDEVLGGFNAAPAARLAQLEWNLERVLQKRLRMARWSMVRWFIRRIRLAARSQTIAVPVNSLVISNLAVFSKHRGRGVGRALLEAACDKAAAGGLDSVSLFVWEDRDDAVRLYLRNGFRIEQAGWFGRDRGLPHTARCLMVRYLGTA